jgi:hypothetical protein
LKAEFGSSKPAEIKSNAISSLRNVAAILAAKAPGDASMARRQQCPNVACSRGRIKQLSLIAMFGWES